MPTERTHVKLILNQSPFLCKFLVDGKEVPFSGVTINAQVNEQLTARVDVIVDEVILDGDYVQLKHGESVNDFLRKNPEHLDAMFEREER